MKNPNPRIGLVALPGHEWNTPWSTTHFTMTQMARHFPVVWVDPPQGIRIGPRASAKETFRARQDPDRFRVYVPGPWFPYVFRSPKLRKKLAWMRVGRALRVLRSLGCEEFVCYAWRPQFALEFEDPRFSARYYHIDDEYTFSDDDGPIPEAELRMLHRADCVFVAGKTMLEKKGGVNPESYLAPNGVEYDLYASESPEPDDLTDVPHPRLGYTGWLKRHLNWPLIEAVVNHNPKWSFVFVGPTSPHPEIYEVIERLRQKPNVWMLGKKPLEEFAAYPQHFDVCIMPYALNGYTKYIVPLKLHEYLASGSPVVATPVPAIRPFAGVLRQATTCDDWQEAVVDTLREGPAPGREERQRIARTYDWGRLADQIADRIRSTWADRQGLRGVEDG